LSGKPTVKETLSFNSSDLRLLDSEASQDVHYISAFTNEPIVRFIILGNTAIFATPRTGAGKDVREAIDELRKI